MANNRIDKIRLNLDADWKVLGSIYDLLYNEKAFCVAADDHSQKILNFVQPDELRKLIDLNVEEYSTHTLEELEALIRLVIKYSVKTGHAGFHNQLFGQMDPYGLAGAWISEALNTNVHTFEVAPVFTLIETEIIRKVCEICGYGVGDGIFSPGGSMSNMYGLILARYKRYPNVKSQGMFGMKPLVAFTSDESHYSLKKASNWMGIGSDNCVLIKTNERGQMLLDDLEAKILQALQEGHEPFFVNSTAGSTVLGAFDDFNGVADICDKYGLWMHVDGCWGASAIVSYTNRHLVAGIERSSSLAWNFHKSLGAPLQCSIFVTREQELLSQCNSIEVNYLFHQDKFYDVSYDTGNKSVQCGRKVDAFKFWLMLKARGYGTFGHLVDHAIHISRIFMEKIKQRGTERFRLVLDEFQYTNICFWYIPKKLRGCEENDEWRKRLYKVAPKIKEKMMREGTIMIGYSPLAHHNLGNFFRMVFSCFPVFQEKDLDYILDEIERLGEIIEY